MYSIMKTGTLKDVIDNLDSTLEITDYDTFAINADSTTRDTIILSDPLLFIPDLNLFAGNMVYCDSDGMADWSGTILFNLEKESESLNVKGYYYESDDIMTTLYNYTHLGTNELSALYAGMFTGDLRLISELLESAFLEKDLHSDFIPDLMPAMAI